MLHSLTTYANLLSKSYNYLCYAAPYLILVLHADSHSKQHMLQTKYTLLRYATHYLHCIKHIYNLHNKVITYWSSQSNIKCSSCMQHSFKQEGWARSLRLVRSLGIGNIYTFDHYPCQSLKHMSWHVLTRQWYRFQPQKSWHHGVAPLGWMSGSSSARRAHYAGLKPSAAIIPKC